MPVIPAIKTDGRFYIGIDPGQDGHAVFINQGGHYIDHVHLGGTEHDIWTEFSELVGIANRFGDGCFAVMEQVHSMKRQGVSSTFKFGQNYGFMRGLLVASGVPHEYATPQKWMKELGMPSGLGKDGNLAKAQQMWPGIGLKTKSGKSAFFDALLIAEYARRIRSKYA